VKWTFVAAAVLFLVLTRLLQIGLNPNSALFDHALTALDQYVVADRNLHREILASRAGLSQNYDGLTRDVAAINETLEQLRAAASRDPEELAAVDRLAAQEVRQEGMVEQFKSRNALLQDSLVHFGSLSTGLAASDQSPEVVAAVTRLAADILYLTLNTSPAAARDVQNRLDELAKVKRPPMDEDSIRALLSRGGMLHDLLPSTDALIKALFIAEITPEQRALRDVIVRHQQSSRQTARLFRFLLYGTSLALLGALVFLGLQLRKRAQALAQRAAFEHAIAGISTRFITLQNGETAPGVERALGELAECIGAGRAYFVLAGTPTRSFRWAARGVAFPPDWPERALELAAHFGEDRDGIVQLPQPKRALNTSSQYHALLAAMDLHDWLCILGQATQASRGILGFDSLRTGPLVRWNDFGLFRMAFDAIANALRRELLEQEKDRLQAGLQQARRMETVGAFATGIAHSFNNIVGAILGYTEMVHAHVEADSRPAAGLNEIRSAGERARELIDQIFTFGRRGDRGRRIVGIKSLIAEAASLANASLPAHVSLRIHDIADTTTVSGNHAQLQQVILNVCNNAACAMETPGTIEIGAQIRDITLAMQTDHGEIGPGRFVIISITDHGRGMDEATLGRIFEPFFTTRMEGNGLGLATVLETVQEHGGTVEVQSSLAVGTRFDIWLPVGADSDPDASPRAVSPPRGQGQSVLIFDTDRARLLRHEEILAALGYEPAGFAEAGEAEAAFLAEPGRFDAALLCHRHRSPSAINLAIDLHEMALPIILATASTTDFNAQALASAGISELIHLPFYSFELADALMRCMPASDGKGQAANSE
jgi:signal transduction histidine kinase